MKKTCVKCDKEFSALHYQKRLCNECAKENQRLVAVKMAKLRAERKVCDYCHTLWRREYDRKWRKRGSK